MTHAIDSATDPDPFTLRPGARLGKYTIVRRLAVGGMAELYLARARGIRGFEKLCALKRARPVLAVDRDFVESFLVEARIAAALDHPNVAHVSDVGVVGNDYFFVMEYVHGEDLRRILREAGKRDELTLACGLEIVMGVARGLHHAHECVGADGRPLQLVHRDVSPSNVLVSFGGDVKIVDFGIAKALAETRQTRAGVLKGKIGYMSPEQCAGESVDRRSDVFGLGILLYEVTTCRRLFRADSEFAVLNKIMTGSFARPSTVVEGYPADLEAVVLRALAVDPDDRHPTAEAFLLDVEAVMVRHGLRASPLVLAEMMRELFGTPPHPIADSIDTGVTPLAAAVDAETLAVDGGRGRRGATMTRTSARKVARAVTVAAGATLAGGLVVGWLGARWTQPEASASVAEVRESPAVAPPAVPNPTPAPAAVPVPVPARVDVAATSSPARAKPPEGAPEKARRSSRKRGVAKRRDAAAAPTDARIFPDSYYERDK